MCQRTEEGWKTKPVVHQRSDIQAHMHASAVLEATVVTGAAYKELDITCP